MSDKVNAFTQFLGAMRIDCGNGFLDHSLDEKGSIIFSNEDAQTKYNAYRVLVGSSDKMGLRQGRVDVLNEVSVHCIKQLNE